MCSVSAVLWLSFRDKKRKLTSSCSFLRKLISSWSDSTFRSRSSLARAALSTSCVMTLTLNKAACEGGIVTYWKVVMHYVFADIGKKNALPHAAQAHSHNSHVNKTTHCVVRQGHEHMHPIKINCRHVASVIADSDWEFSRDRIHCSTFQAAALDYTLSNWVHLLKNYLRIFIVHFLLLLHYILEGRTVCHYSSYTLYSYIYVNNHFSD